MSVYSVFFVNNLQNATVNHAKFDYTKYLNNSLATHLYFAENAISPYLFARFAFNIIFMNTIGTFTMTLSYFSFRYVRPHIQHMIRRVLSSRSQKANSHCSLSGQWIVWKIGRLLERNNVKDWFGMAGMAGMAELWHKWLHINFLCLVCRLFWLMAVKDDRCMATTKSLVSNQALDEKSV